MPGDLAPGEPVVLDRAEVNVRKLLQRLLGKRTLDGDLRVEIAVVADVDVRELADRAAHPLDVLFASTGVDDDQVVVVAELVQDHIVDKGAVRREHGAVVCLAGLQLPRVVHEQVLQRVQRTGPTKLDAAHVRDIKNAHGVAHGMVLGDKAAILHRHLPTAKIDHLRAERLVHRKQAGAPQGVLRGNRGCGNGTHAPMVAAASGRFEERNKQRSSVCSVP